MFLNTKTYSETNLILHRGLWGPTIDFPIAGDKSIAAIRSAFTWIGFVIFDIYLRWVRDCSSFSGTKAIGPLLVAQLLVFFAPCSASDDELHIISSLINGRERLYAGEVSIRGLERHSDLESKSPPNVRSISELMRFDFANGRLWHEVERTWADMPVDAKPPIEVYVYGKDGVFRKDVDSRTVTVGKPAPPNAFWDLRVFGLCTYDDLLRFTKLSDFEVAFREASKNGTLMIHSQFDGELIVIDYLNSSSAQTPETLDVRRRIWIDPARDHVPVRTEQHFKDTGSLDTDADGWALGAVSSATWERLDNDVWVPESAMVLMKVGDSSGGMTIEYELAFEWHSVNPPLDESRFSLATLDAPAGSHHIIDYSIDRTNPIYVQHPLVPDAKVLRKIIEANSRIPEPPKLRSGPHYIVVLGSLATMLLLGFLFWRKARLRSV